MNRATRARTRGDTPGARILTWAAERPPFGAPSARRGYFFSIGTRVADSFGAGIRTSRMPSL